MKRLIAAIIMIALVLISLAGGVYMLSHGSHGRADFVQENATTLALAALFSLAVAWVLIRSSKKGEKNSRMAYDNNQHCVSCGRWVPSPYLKHGQYCYACFEEMRAAEEENTAGETRYREVKKNTAADREPFPFQAELDRRIFDFLANEKEKDPATMIQAMAESDGNKQRAAAKYFKLRYKQMDEAGELGRFMNRILKEKRKSLDKH